MRLFLHKGPVTPIAVPSAVARESMWHDMDTYAKADNPVQRSVCVSTISH